MKKTIFMTIAFAMSVMANAQSLKTKVSGQLTGLGDSVLYNIIDRNLDNARLKGSYPVKDGKFEFTVDLKNPSYLVLLDLAQIKSGDASNIMAASCVIMPGEDLTVKGTMVDYTIAGSKFYDECQATKSLYTDLYKKMNRNNRDSVSNAITALTMNYIKANPNKESSLTLIDGLSYDNLMEVKKIVSPEILNGRMAPYFNAMVKTLEEAKAREAAAKKIVEGTMAPDFTLPDINGKPLKLSSMRGKYVILDFWGSWCSWCIKGMPEMMKYYDKYKGKFEILGVDCSDTEDRWKAAVEKHKIPWLHVRQSKETVNVSDEYGVSGFPTKVLIDPQGKISKIIVGESPEFYEYIDSLFK